MNELLYPFAREQYNEIKTKGISSGQLVSQLTKDDVGKLVAYINKRRLQRSGFDLPFDAESMVVTKAIAPQLFKIYNPDDNTWRLADKNGYIRIYNERPNEQNWTKFIYEHRDVMEKVLKRKLEGQEVVHHQNRVRSHNTEDNLELAANKSEHVYRDHYEWIKKKAFVSELFSTPMEKLADLQGFLNRLRTAGKATASKVLLSPLAAYLGLNAVAKAHKSLDPSSTYAAELADIMYKVTGRAEGASSATGAFIGDLLRGDKFDIAKNHALDTYHNAAAISDKVGPALEAANNAYAKLNEIKDTDPSVLVGQAASTLANPFGAIKDMVL